MECTRCGYGKFDTDNTRNVAAGITRHRTCRNCGHRFTTIEIPAGNYRTMMNENERYKNLLAGLADALHHAAK